MSAVPRCYCPEAGLEMAEPTLDADEARRLLRVLRLEQGDEVELFDGRGVLARATLVAVDGRVIRLRRDGPPQRLPPPACRITLFQALIKGPRMDWIVEKCVELGASRLVPLRTERIVARLEAPAQTDSRLARWRRMTLEAARQCGTPWATQVDPPMSLARVLTAWPRAAPLLMGSLRAGARPLRDCLEAPPPSEAGILIGPEGDLTDAEQTAALRAGACAVGFGPRTLRAETAALFALSLVSAAWGEARR